MTFMTSSQSMYNVAGPNTCHGCGAILQVKLSVGRKFSGHYYIHVHNLTLQPY
jgi:hypothetical protein